MEVNATIRLFADYDVDPTSYWVTGSSTYDTTAYQLRANGNETFDPTLDDNGDYRLVLLAANCTGSQTAELPISHIVDLGELSSSGSECDVIVDVFYNNARVGGGIVRLATAEQGTRPG